MHMLVNTHSKGDGTKSLGKIQAKWKQYNDKLDSCNNVGKPVRKVVRQRTCGKWVAEIREPNRGNMLQLCNFPTAIRVALAYDEAVRAMYRSCAHLNFPNAKLILYHSYILFVSFLEFPFLYCTRITMEKLIV